MTVTGDDVSKFIATLVGIGATIIGKLIWDTIKNLRIDIKELRQDVHNLQVRESECGERFVHAKEYERVLMLLDENSKQLRELTASVSRITGILSRSNDE